MPPFWKDVDSYILHGTASGGTCVLREDVDQYLAMGESGDLTVCGFGSYSYTYSGQWFWYDYTVH